MLYLNGGAIYVGSDNATVHDTGVAQIETTFFSAPEWKKSWNHRIIDDLFQEDDSEL